MSTIDVVDNIKKETGSKLTPAQICYELKKAASVLSEDKIKQIQAEKPLTSDEKKEAMTAIGGFLTSREADNATLTREQLLDTKQIAASVENSEDKSQAVNSKGAQSSTKVQSKEGKEGKESKDKKEALSSPTNDEVKLFVIPVIADKIITNGKDGIEANTVTYDSDSFTAMLRLGDEEQVISLDRKDASPENTSALVAAKGNNQQEYKIIINNVNREEFERFKALFDKATQKHSNADREQSNRDDGNGELG